VLRRLTIRLCAVLLGLLVAATPVWALSAASLPATAPLEPVLDRSEVLSRAARSAITRQLQTLSQQGVEAHLITLPRLDYGLGLAQLAQELLDSWQVDDPDRQLLLLLIDTQTNGAAVVASSPLSERLGPSLMRSIARTTLAQPLRDGGRYRQASLDAIARIEAVLGGEADPGEPLTAEVITTRKTTVPSRAQTEASNAWIWITVLLVVGTLVPMLTWWVFSR